MDELITFALQERASTHTHKLRETCVALHECYLSLIIALQKNSKVKIRVCGSLKLPEIIHFQ